MKKNKKGFTLIEILAAITIMGILTGIAVVSVTRIIEQGKEKHYTTAEENMILAGQTFVQQNRSNLPKAIGQKKKIPMKMLVEKNYIQPIKDYSDNACDMDKSYIQVFKYSQKDYSYVAYLECPNYNSKENINDITPKIEAKIDENEEARTAHANIKITGNDKIVSYSYVLYRNNKEVKNTGNVQEKSLPATKNINFSLEDYTPGNIKIVVTATNIHGNTKTATAIKNIPDRKKPKCIIKEEDLPTSPKPWIKEGTRKISVGCEDGETGSGCTKTEYYKVFKTSMRTGTITIEDESGNKEECEVSVYIDKVNPTITVSAYKLNSSGNKTGNALKSVSTTTTSNSKSLDLATLNETEWLNKKDYPYGIYYEFTLNDNLELDTYSLKGNTTGLTKTNSAVNTISRVISNSNISGTSKTKNTSITTDGYNKTKVEIKDAAGNSATVTITTPLDRVAPTVPTINMYQWKNNSTTPTSASGLLTYENDTWSNKNVYTTASASTDGMSGFKEYQYTTTGKTENNTNKAAQTRNIKAEGISYIKYRACDIAGNCSEYTDNKTIKLDKTNPTCEVTGGSTSWINATSTTQKRTIKATCVDNGSQCLASTAVITKDYSDDINTTIAGAIGVGQGGTVYDNAGNSVNCSANQTVKIDKTLPTVPTINMYKWTNNSTTPTSASGLTSYTNNTWSNKNIYTTASGSTDATSGIKEYQYTTTGETENNTNKAAQTRNVKAEGISYIKYRACDNAGNCSNYTENQTIKIDKTVPTCEVTGGSTIWINASSSETKRTITARCVDGGSTCDSATAVISKDYSEDMNITNAGALGIGQGGIVYDNAGNSIECAANQTVKIDKTAPTCTSSGGSTNWTNKTVTLTGTCSDTNGSGCKENITLDYKTNIETTTASPGTVYDKAGNSASCPANQTVKIDKTKPTCTSSGGNAGWTNKNVTLTGTCSDTGGSGCTNITYTYDKNTETTTASPGTVYDGAGNSASCPGNQTVKIDKTAPTCTSSGGNANWTNQSVTLTGTCSDKGGSGCSNVTLKYENNVETTTASPGTVYDGAGNSAICPANQTVKIDKTAPTCTSSGGSSDWTNQNITLTGTCSDTGGSGCKENVTKTFNTNKNLSSQTPGTVYDKAGNSANCPANQTVKIDKTAPSCSTTTNYSSWTNQNVTLTGTCSDTGGSGCKGNATSTYTTEMNESKSPGTVYDYAGNSKTCPTKTVRIDKTPPTANPSVAGIYVETYGSDGVTDTGKGKVLGGSCSGLSCTVTVCVPNVKGSFQVFGFERNPSDSLSGYWTYDYTGRTMYDKNWVATGGGCLKTKGHNPCNWYSEYTIYDQANNSAKITFNIIVGYIGLKDGSGC